jgi:microcystin-dependent protein
MEAFIGTIMGWAPNFAPQGWAFCAGQQLSIQQNTALYSLLGVTYGGNGQTVFNLPDMRGRVPVGIGQHPGGSNYILGQASGAETTTLLITNMPTHTHPAAVSNLSVSISASSGAATTNAPGPDDVLAATNGQDSNGRAVTVRGYGPSSGANTTLHGGSVTGDVSIGMAGGGMPFNNMQPFLGINFIICMFGIYPPRAD